MTAMAAWVIVVFHNYAVFVVVTFYLKTINNQPFKIPDVWKFLSPYSLIMSVIYLCFEIRMSIKGTVKPYPNIVWLLAG